MLEIYLKTVDVSKLSSSFAIHFLSDHVKIETNTLHSSE